MNPNIYRQNDPRWGSLAYPRTPSTVATDGCGLRADRSIMAIMN